MAPGRRGRRLGRRLRLRLARHPLDPRATRLLTTPPGTDCVLSDAEEAAHARTADRMNYIWAHGSGIDRYLY